MLTLEGLISVISLVLGAVSLGYAIGKDRRVKNTVDTVFFTQEVCVEAPQTSAGSHRRNHLRDFASGVSAHERFDMSERVPQFQAAEWSSV
jgi:hypothetical protein